MIDDEISTNDDKELCEEALETVTTVVNKHLAHVTTPKQV